MKCSEIICDRCGHLLTSKNVAIDGLFGTIGVGLNDLGDSKDEGIRYKDEQKIKRGFTREIRITVLVRDELECHNLDLCESCKKIYIAYIRKYLKDLLPGVEK